MFVDCKDVMVFVRPRNIPANGHIYVGVERSSRRCTLVAYIGLDGDTLIPTVLTKTKTVNSYLFDRGYSVNTLLHFNTENSFITADVLRSGCVRFSCPTSRRSGAC